MNMTVPAPFFVPVASFVGDMHAEPTDDPFAELLATLIGASGALAMQGIPAGPKAPAPPPTSFDGERGEGAGANRLTSAIAAGRDALVALAHRSRR